MVESKFPGKSKWQLRTRNDKAGELEMDVPVDELVKALASEEESAKFMERHNLTMEDFVERAELLNRYLNSAVIDVTRV
ncbi:hypothetical protein SJ05684_b55480 (plasmid) [Sinorhizobium sojae CCBAU 05684]|uniref:Uncharacterized protein n=2 Tax=Sinorhizobium sojae TaxID=716925 RepID=A0A249PKR6_9HYPH|nr:hypothetical protein SJ05684_b55480 [Sinorhizobium sojae CCBAU 05684]